MQLDMFANEIIVDLFAGGGGTSTGIEAAIGRPVDIAINHDPAAIAMHHANHPHTVHYIENVWEVDPREATWGRPVGLLWLSPDCKHFSKAKGGKPVEKSIRGLAWVALRWAALVDPRMIMLENVEEFKTWGPLNEEGNPIRELKGETFEAFKACLSTGLRKDHPAWEEIRETLGDDFPYEKLEKGLGYEVDHQELLACDLGAPTARNRFYFMARRDGRPIVWPEPTHGNPESLAVKSGRLKPWRTAAEIIDWSKPCPSIFDPKDKIKNEYGINAVRPLADKTLQRITRGLKEFVIENPEPFIAPEGASYLTKYHDGYYHGAGSSLNSPLSTITTKDRLGLVTAYLTQYHSYEGDGVRGQTLGRPLLTIDTNPRYALAAAFISKYYGTGEGSNLNGPLHTITTKDRNALIETHLCVLRNNMDCKSLTEPLPTITTSPGHFAEVRTVLVKYDSRQDLGHWPEVREILNKYCSYNIADDEILLLNINGILYFISDIGLRMLGARELSNAQGFPADYIIDQDDQGKPYPKSQQVAKIGNSVSPPVPKALVEANLPELCGEQLREGVGG